MTWGVTKGCEVTLFRGWNLSLKGGGERRSEFLAVRSRRASNGEQGSETPGRFSLVFVVPDLRGGKVTFSGMTAISHNKSMKKRKVKLSKIELKQRPLTELARKENKTDAPKKGSER